MTNAKNVTLKGFRQIVCENLKWIKQAEGNICEVRKHVLNLPASRYGELRGLYGRYCVNMHEDLDYTEL